MNTLYTRRIIEEYYRKNYNLSATNNTFLFLDISWFLGIFDSKLLNAFIGHRYYVLKKMIKVIFNF